MHLLFTARNFIRAGVAGALVFASLGLAVGFAVAADEAEQSLPETLHMAAPSVGDSWTYSGFNDTASWTESFAWSHAANIRDGYGNLQSAVALGDPQQIDPRNPLAGFSVWHDGAGKPIALGGNDIHDYESIRTSSLSPVVTSQTVQMFDARISWMFAELPAFCLWTHAGQGNELPLAELSAVLDDCVLPRESELAAESRGLQATEVVSTTFGNGLRLESFDGELSVTLVPHVPYPVELVVGGDDPYTFELETFEAGRAGFAGSNILEAGPEVDMIPLAPWGFDMPGHPFPAKEAFDAALADPTWTVLQEWLLGHPGAVPLRMQFDQWHQLGNEEAAWEFELISDDSVFYFTVDRTRPADEFMDQLDISERPVARYQFEGESGPVRYEVAQTSAPDLADVLQRLALFSAVNETGPFAGYRFYPGCAECNMEDQFRFEFMADQYQSVGTPLPADDSTYRADVMVSADGRFASVLERSDSSKQSQRIVTQGSSSQSPPPSRPSEAAPLQVSHSGVWSSPGGATAAGAGAAALATAAVVWLWPALKGLPVLGLFSRVRRHELLGHPQRQKILRAIEESPGIHFQELLRTSGLSNGGAVHHLRKLVEGGLVVEGGSTGYTCYFPKGKIDRSVMAAAPVIRSQKARQILQAVSSSPGLSAKDVAGQVGLSPATLNYHVRRLVDAGLLDAPRRGNSLELALTRTGQTVLAA